MPRPTRSKNSWVYEWQFAIMAVGIFSPLQSLDPPPNPGFEVTLRGLVLFGDKKYPKIAGGFDSPGAPKRPLRGAGKCFEENPKRRITAKLWILLLLQRVTYPAERSFGGGFREGNRKPLHDFLFGSFSQRRKGTKSTLCYVEAGFGAAPQKYPRSVASKPGFGAKPRGFELWGQRPSMPFKILLQNQKKHECNYKSRSRGGY